jgi:DNA-binding response OmpR family regulator
MPKHIVVIEDNPDILSLITDLLEDEGYSVTPFPALTSIEALIELNPDCFILDEQLPHVSGHILCMLLKSKPPTKNVPVILISASNHLESFADLSEADAWLKKPFEINDLVNLVAGVIK